MWPTVTPNLAPKTMEHNEALSFSRDIDRAIQEQVYQGMSEQCHDGLFEGAFCAFKLCTEAHAWTMPATDCMTPKKTVMKNTSTATQNVNHCVFFRSSHHNCEILLGSASSNVRFRSTNRSLQKTKFSICRCELLSRAQLPACASILCFRRCFRNHGLNSPNIGGTRSEIVRIVSSTRPS